MNPRALRLFQFVLSFLVLAVSLPAYENFKGEVRNSTRRRVNLPVPEKNVMSFKLAPHAYRVFRLK